MKTKLHSVSRSVLTASMLAGILFNGSMYRSEGASDLPDSANEGESTSAQSGTQSGCNNLYDPGLWCESCEDGESGMFWWANALTCPSGGVNAVNMANGSVQRAVGDLMANGGVGGHRLHWTRYGQSRLVTGERHFGDGHVWRIRINGKCRMWARLR